jgi:hypothetical protein
MRIRDRTHDMARIIPSHNHHVQIASCLRRRIRNRHGGLRRLGRQVVALDIGGCGRKILWKQSRRCSSEE